MSPTIMGINGHRNTTSVLFKISSELKYLTHELRPSESTSLHRSRDIESEPNELHRCLSYMRRGASVGMACLVALAAHAQTPSTQPRASESVKLTVRTKN